MEDEDADGIYEVTVVLEPLSTIRFKFINGNNWYGVEAIPSACGEPDGFGFYDRVETVALESVTIGYVFGTCDPAKEVR